MYKKIVAFLLALALILPMLISVSADEIPSAMPYEEEKAALYEQLSNASVARGSYIEVGTISIVVCAYHAFIIIHNTSGYTLYLGAYALADGATVTIGTFGSRGEAPRSHSGIYYNMEAYYRYYDSSEYANNVSLKLPLDASGYITIDQMLSNQANNTHTDYTNNCAHFAVRVWNAGISNWDPAYSLTVSNNLMSDIESYAISDTEDDIPAYSYYHAFYLSSSGSLVNIYA